MKADQELGEDEVCLVHMEQVVVTLEEEHVSNESKMRLAEQETKKHCKEMVVKEKKFCKTLRRWKTRLDPQTKQYLSWRKRRVKLNSTRMMS